MGRISQLLGGLCGMKFLVRCSLLWAGLLILESEMVWGGQQGQMISFKEEPVILGLSSCYSEQTSYREIRKHTVSFTDMRDLKTDYVECANLAKVSTNTHLRAKSAEIQFVLKLTWYPKDSGHC